MKAFRIGVVILIAFILNACFSSMRIATDYAKEVDFTAFKSYEFYGWSPEISMFLDEDQKGYVETALKNEMTTRNIKNIRAGGDLIVSVHIIVKDKTAFTTYNYNYHASSLDYTQGMRWINSYSPTSFTKVHFKEGTMIIDIFDNKTKKVIWQGVASQGVEKGPGSIKANLEKTVAAILVDFPPMK